MKLSINLIYHYLKESFFEVNLHNCSPNDNKMLFNPPLIYSDTIELEPNKIFVIYSDMLPEDLSFNGQCLLILPDAPKRIEGKSGITYITVPGADVPEIFNAVHGIFNRFLDWDGRLQDLVFQNASVEEFLKASYPFIGNTISVHNNNFNYIAKYSPQERDFLVHSHESSFFDPDYLLRVDEEIEDSVFYSHNLIYYKDKHTHVEHFFLNLFNGNTTTGRLVVTSNHRGFMPYDASLVLHLGKYLEAILSYMAFSGSGKNLRRDSLLEFLSGKTHSDDKILHLKTVSPFSRLQDGQNLYILVCDRQNSELSEQYTAFQLEHALPESVCVPFDKKLVLLCSNEAGQSDEEFFGVTTALLNKYNLIAGCSNPFKDFFDLRYCYKQALFTLRNMEISPTLPPLNNFKQHVLDYILKNGTSEMPPRMLCADCIKKMSDHDITAQVSYCDSLRVYLNTGRNLAETARILDITRNTFITRLERIMRFIDLDLENEDNRLYLLISLKLMPYSQQIASIH